MAFNFNYPNGTPQDRGWGPGWQPGMPIGTRPSAYPGEIVTLEVGGVGFPGGVRAELRELSKRLLQESLMRGFIPNLMEPGCWGGAFRPTKDSSGNYTNYPSNHSWYTALDINAPRNVFGATTHEIPQAMADLWKSYGWRWLGPPIKDWMHFDFAGSPDDARAMLDKARAAGLGEETDVTGDELLEGIIAFIQGDPAPQDGPALRVYKALTLAASSSAAPEPHEHPHTHRVPGEMTGAVVAP